MGFFLWKETQGSLFVNKSWGQNFAEKSFFNFFFFLICEYATPFIAWK